MNEGDTAATSEKIGDKLRAAREAANATLDDISALLKIRSDHLQALENDDFERLPGSVYAIGFIRTYATHLGLNAGELIERYKRRSPCRIWRTKAPIRKPNMNRYRGGPENCHWCGGGFCRLYSLADSRWGR